MNFLSTFMKQHGANMVMLFFCVTVPILGGFMSYTPAPTRVTLQAAETSPVEELGEMLQVIAQRQPAKPEPLKTALSPVPDPLIMAISRLSEADSVILKQLSALDARLNSIMHQTANRQVSKHVDRSGNTQEALNDIYSDVEVPVLPDAMAKGLAKYPGARVVNHPQTGIPVLAKTEWIVTHGGRVHQLKRHNGIERPVTIHYGLKSKQEETQQQQPPAFRISN